MTLAHALISLALVAIAAPALVALVWFAAAETRAHHHRRSGGYRYGPPPPIKRGQASPLARCATWGPHPTHAPRAHVAELPEAAPPITFAPMTGEGPPPA